MSFLPSRLLLLCLAGLVPLSMWAAASAEATLLVAVAALALLGTFLWQGVFWLNPRDVEIERQLPLVLSVGERAEVLLKLRNRGSRSLAICLADGCPAQLAAGAESISTSLGPFETITLRYPILPAERGVHSFLPLHLRMRTRAGLAERCVSLKVIGEARVHPNLRNVRRYQLKARRALLRQPGARRTRLQAAQGDFERLRDFVTGDDVRHLDWKATARLGRPITRVFQMERSQTVLILVDGTRLMAGRAGDLTKMDYAVNAALMLSHVGLARGDRVGVAVFDQSLRAYLPPRAGSAQFGRVVDLLFDQQATRTLPRYREAARQIVGNNRRRSLLVWITDLMDGDQGQELLAAVKSLRNRHLSLVVAVTAPTITRLAGCVPDDPKALFGATAAGEMLAERDVLVRRLRLAGAEVVSSVPEDISDALVTQYLDLKERGRL